MSVIAIKLFCWLKCIRCLFVWLFLLILWGCISPFVSGLSTEGIWFGSIPGLKTYLCVAKKKLKKIKNDLVPPLLQQSRQYRCTELHVGAFYKRIFPFWGMPFPGTLSHNDVVAKKKKKTLITALSSAAPPPSHPCRDRQGHDYIISCLNLLCFKAWDLLARPFCCRAEQGEKRSGLNLSGVSGYPALPPD